MNKFIKILIYALAVFVTAYILPGVMVSGFIAALITAIVIAAINIFVRPLVLLLTLPINILTLGLFTFVINALLIMLAAAIVPGFDVASFWWAVLFSIVLAIVSSFLNSMVREDENF